MIEQRTPAVGKGTYKYSGTPDGTVTLLALCALSAIPEDVSGFDLHVVSGTAFVQNDGTTATADDAPLPTSGHAMAIRDNKWLIAEDQFKFYSAGACVFVVQLWG